MVPSDLLVNVINPQVMNSRRWLERTNTAQSVINVTTCTPYSLQYLFENKVKYFELTKE